MEEKVLGFPIHKNKYVEFQVGKWGKDNHQNIFDIGFKITNKCDHSGISFDLDIIGFHFYFKFYDTRHWNYEENRWMNEDDYKKIQTMPTKTKKQKDMKYEELEIYYACENHTCCHKSLRKLFEEIERRDIEINKLNKRIK
jgi:hypothetical protein